jgi:hypothetical protein
MPTTLSHHALSAAPRTVLAQAKLLCVEWVLGAHRQHGDARGSCADQGAAAPGKYICRFMRETRSLWQLSPSG